MGNIKGLLEIIILYVMVCVFWYSFYYIEAYRLCSFKATKCADTLYYAEVCVWVVFH